MKRGMGLDYSIAKINIQNMEFAEAYVEMFDLLDDCILVVDMEGRIVLLNKASEDLDEVSREDVIGAKLDQVYVSERYHSATMACLNHKKAVINKVQSYTTVYGKSVLTISSSYPLVKDLEMLGVITITKDITKFYKIMDVFHHYEPKIGKSIEGNSLHTFDDLIGKSEAITNAIENARMIATTRANVLIYGETGTGKELFAQSIHTASGVSGNFVPINCAAIPENLLESLLFGTSKGAFTGAVDSAGLFEEAEDGTLFLDEIHAMSADLQAKLLRAVETRKIRRVGETKEEKINFRLLTAINIHPQEAIKNGLLRRDLYYRLGVVTVTIPGLRDRTEDIPLLAQHFLEKANESHFRHISGISESVLKVFSGYNWPGNVRELEHTIEHSCVVAEEGGQIQFADLPTFFKEKIQETVPEGAPVSGDTSHIFEDASLEAYLNRIEKQVIENHLEKNNGNISQTALQLGMSRQALGYRLKKLGVTPANRNGRRSF